MGYICAERRCWIAVGCSCCVMQAHGDAVPASFGRKLLLWAAVRCSFSCFALCFIP